MVSKSGRWHELDKVYLVWGENKGTMQRPEAIWKRNSQQKRHIRKHNLKKKIQSQRMYYEIKLKKSTLIQRNWPNASNNAEIYMKYPWSYWETWVKRPYPALVAR